jgi:transcriptional regulator with XRE-family HTH domain
MKKFAEFKKELLADSEVRAEYDGLEAEFQIAQAIISARAKARLSQAGLAALMNTKQPAIARLESGKSRPTLATLQAIATATGQPITLRIEPKVRRAS